MTDKALKFLQLKPVMYFWEASNSFQDYDSNE